MFDGAPVSQKQICVVYDMDIPYIKERCINVFLLKLARTHAQRSPFSGIECGGINTRGEDL